MTTTLRPYKGLVIHLCTSGGYWEANLHAARVTAEDPDSSPEAEYWLIEFQLPNGLDAFAECWPHFNDWSVWIDANGISNSEREKMKSEI